LFKTGQITDDRAAIEIFVSVNKLQFAHNFYDM